MNGLQRHDLVHLHPDAWQRLRRQAVFDARAHDVLRVWAERDLPLVVCRSQQVADGQVALGLAAPSAWQRRRLALTVSREAIRAVVHFPSLRAVAATMPAAAARQACALDEALRALGVQARVHGSYGWQALSGLDHVHADSDLDLLIAVRHGAQADAAAALLAAVDAPWRIDGELLVGDGWGLAWREFERQRRGLATTLLAKRLDRLALLDRAGVEALFEPQRQPRCSTA